MTRMTRRRVVLVDSVELVVVAPAPVAFAEKERRADRAAEVGKVCEILWRPTRRHRIAAADDPGRRYPCGGASPPAPPAAAAAAVPPPPPSSCAVHQPQARRHVPGESGDHGSTVYLSTISSAIYLSAIYICIYLSAIYSSTIYLSAIYTAQHHGHAQPTLRPGCHAPRPKRHGGGAALQLVAAGSPRREERERPQESERVPQHLGTTKRNCDNGRKTVNYYYGGQYHFPNP